MRKIKPKKLLYALAFFLFFSCENQPEEIVPEEKPDRFTIEQIQVAEDSHLIDLLNSFQQETKVNGKILDNIGNIDTAEAIKVTDLDHDVVNYTLSLTSDLSDNSELFFENLIFEEREGVVEEYILRYIPNVEWIEASTSFDMVSYSGIVERLDLERNIVSAATLKNGTSFHENTANGKIQGIQQECDWHIWKSETTHIEYLIIDCSGGGSSGAGSGGNIWTGDYQGDSRSGSGSAGGDRDFGGGGLGSNNGTGGSSSRVVGIKDNPQILMVRQITRENDPEEKRKLQLTYIRNYGGKDGRTYANLIEEILTTPGLTVGDVAEINGTVNNRYLELKGSYFMAIYSPDNMATIFTLGLSTSITPTLRNNVFKTLARYSGATSGKGFSTFEAFKKVYGEAGPGKAWHHIVEQHAHNVSKFGTNKIHNTSNLVKVAAGKGSTHAKITGFYNSKKSFTFGKTVRDWIKTKPFEEQYEFGLEILYKVRNNIPLPN